MALFLEFPWAAPQRQAAARAGCSLINYSVDPTATSQKILSTAKNSHCAVLKVTWWCHRQPTNHSPFDQFVDFRGLDSVSYETI